MTASPALTLDDELDDLDLQDLVKYLSSVHETIQAGTTSASSFVLQPAACTQNLPPRLIQLATATGSDGARTPGNQT